MSGTLPPKLVDVMPSSSALTKLAATQYTNALQSLSFSLVAMAFGGEDL
jgi:hypothetical protein